jgi:uncharacterized damage-inducible protein DinB
MANTHIPIDPRKKDYRRENMATDRPVLAALVLDTFVDLERSLEGLGRVEAETRSPGLSSINWTVAHIGQTIDVWLISGVANLPRDSYLSKNEFSKGGSGGGNEWEATRKALSRVLDRSRTFLQTVSQDDLEKQTLYEGSLEPLKGKLVARYYWLARVVAHTYYHIGEITTIRSSGGHKVVDFPSNLTSTYEVKGNK